MRYYIYILYSITADRYYVGSSGNPQNRLSQHNTGRNKSTKHGIPWKIAYTEVFATRSEALKRENEIKGKKVVCIISGGNNDFDRMAEIKELSLQYEGKKHYFLVQFPQRPGALKLFVTEVMGPTDDITRFEFIKKTQRERGPALVGIEVQSMENYESLIERMKLRGFDFKEINSDKTLFEYFI